MPGKGGIVPTFRAGADAAPERLDYDIIASRCRQVDILDL
jgi:hypothetical protein